MKRNEMKPNEMKYNETKRKMKKRNETKRNEVSQNETKYWVVSSAIYRSTLGCFSVAKFKKVNKSHASIQ
jgi:hypothetical protein